MGFFSDFTQLELHQTSAVALGNFDGVHLGHQALLAQVARSALSQGLCPSVLTFEPHPVRLFAPHVPFAQLMSDRERATLLNHYGIHLVLAQRFDRAFAKLSADEFVTSVLVSGLRAKVVVVGYDFKYGAGRTGDIDHLSGCAERHGFEVVVVDAIRDETGGAISSSRVRNALAAGDVPMARQLLGRPMHSRGTVEPGEQRGRGMGFPTANIDADVRVLAPPGVYSGWLDYGEGPKPSIANLGQTPTFGPDRPTRLEVHVLEDTVPDLYGRDVRFWFESQLRAERRFDSIEHLKRQISEDVQLCKDDLCERPLPPGVTLDVHLKAGLLGENIQQSLSPALHALLGRSVGLRVRYELFDVNSEDLPSTLAGLKSSDLHGWNVTAPFKEAAFRAVDELGHRALALGAVNTVKRASDGRLVGFNTDYDGFHSLASDVLSHSVALLGAGGAAAPAVDILSRTSSNVFIYNRTADRAHALTRRLNADATVCSRQEIARRLSQSRLVVNAAGVGGEDILSDDALSSMGPDSVIIDLRYGPCVASLRDRALSHGHEFRDGLPMLVAQGIAAFTRWTGRTPNGAGVLQELRTALDLKLRD